MIFFIYFNMNDFIIAVDFDGTMVEHKYPLVGEEVPGAVHVMHELIEAGHNLILYTMRDNINKVPEWPEPYNCAEADTVLHQAVKWCADHNIKLLGVNCNPRVNFSKSPKVYANVYIDDTALGCPLVLRMDERGYKVGRPMVDWFAVEGWLVDRGLLPKRTLPGNFYVTNNLFPITK